MTKKNFWQKLKRPIKVLAPMAGYTDSTFRLMCKKFDADVVISELVSADAIAYAKIKNQKSKIKIGEDCLIYNKVAGRKHNSTADLLSFYEAERPFVVQLFGKNPANFAKAAKWITENLKPDGIDINMGCPARKVIGSDHGAALLKNPALAVEIVKAVKENTDLPVSVKTRLGWEKDDEILEFAPLLADAGISAIIIHGRTYKDGFGGVARWENIYKVKEILGKNIVVIGNGDIGINQKSKIKNQNEGGCSMVGLFKSEKNKLDGIAIGRASFGRPWIFAEGKKQNTDNRIQITELKEIILKHAKLAEKTKGEKGIVELRKHLLAYLKGFPNAKILRLEAVKITNVLDVKKILERLD
jgi:nifR3 family TIM-barrel protein